MTESSRDLVLIIGFPESGKSTFLGALLHCVSDSQAGTRLRLSQNVGEFPGLWELEQCWLACNEIQRTVKEAESMNVIPLRHEASGRDYELIFPDLSGEQFEAQWRERYCDSEYARLVTESVGVVLMVNPEKIRHAPRLEDLPAAARSGNGVQTGDVSLPSEWNADDTPTQVKLVDLLQSFLDLKGGSGSEKLAVVVSLWDKVVPSGQGPEDVARSRFPLLHQFLVASRRFDTRYFGVSAQGGDYNTDREKLVTLSPPFERIKIIAPQHEGHDLTLPIVWSLGLDTEDD